MQLADTNRFFLEGTNKQFLHIATVLEGVREYMCFANVNTNEVYIEEVTGGHLEFIEDDALATALHDFLVDRKVLLMDKPLLADNDWLRRGKTD